MKDSAGDRMSSYQISRKINDEELHQSGMCTLNPKWEAVVSDHFCGRHKPERGLAKTVSDYELIWGHNQRRHRADDTANEPAHLLVRASAQATAARGRWNYFIHGISLTWSTHLAEG